MRLKFIELFGFKTFPDKVRIPFSGGINIIVGPNGCGKTNIVDALRFILGEQNLKDLRLKSMNDLIFHGSNMRNGSSVALCRGVFENDGGGSFKYKDFSEIMVERRHFKNRETEYRINGISVPYKEYLDFFNESGLSRHYSIIDASRINALLNYKPNELRLFFEEASGITKYKIQKKSASKKLEAAVGNLLRIGDLLNEVEKQLAVLEMSAKKLEEYKKIETQKIRFESALYTRIRSKIVSDTDKYRLDLENYSIQFTEANAKSDTMLNALTDAKTAFDKVESAYKTASVQKNRYLVELAKLNSALEYTGVKTESLKSEIEKKIKETEEQKESKNRNSEKLSSFKEKLSSDESNFKSLAEKLNLISKSVIEKKELMLKNKNLIENINEEILDIMEKLQNGNNKLLFINKNIKNIELKINETKNTIAKIYAETYETALDLKKKTKLLNDASSVMEDVKIKYSKNEIKLAELELNFKEHGLKKDALEKDLLKIGMEISRLAEFIDNREGFSEGTRDFLKADKDYKVFPLTDFIEIEPGFENAATESIGDVLEAVILGNIKDTEKAIDYINASKKGKIKIFIPNQRKNNGHVKYENSQCNICAELGLIPIKEKIKLNFKQIDPEDININFYYCEDKNRILEYIEQNGFFPEVNIVTEEGIIFNSDGFITAGKNKNIESMNLFINKNKLSEYKELETKKQEEFKSAESLFASIQSEIKELKMEKEKINNEIKKSEIAKLTAENDIKHLENILGKSKERLDILIKESANLEIEKDSEYKEKRELEDEILILENEYGLKIKEKGAEEENLREIEDEFEKLKEDETALKIEINSAGQNINFLKKQIKDLEYSILNYDNRIKSLHEQKEKYESEINNTAADLKLKQKNIEVLNESVKEIDAVIKDGETDLESLKKKIADGEREIENTKAQILNIDKKKDAIQTYININAEKLAELDFNRSINGIPAEFSEEDRVFIDSVNNLNDTGIKKTIEELSLKIKELGDINMNAAKEYESALERLDFLGRQKKDLENSIEALNGIIKKLDAVSKEKFKSNMAEIRQKFKELFVFLFGGGNADISLNAVSRNTPEFDESENNGDAAELQGMEINVRIPGKKFTGINILSQGEKVLVAVSLLFSIFLVKKTPFCVIDEVDAPLDYANNARYNKLIREISNYSQIILITHNKKTMEIGKNIFGVTSKHPGISGIVSVSMS